MSPDEVIERLKDLGVEISRPTLSRYEKQGLIPEPKRGSLGRAGGRFSEYPPETVSEAFAAWSLLHGKYFSNFFGGPTPKIPPQTIKHFREAVLTRMSFSEVEKTENEIIDKEYGGDRNKYYQDISPTKEERDYASRLFKEENSFRDNMTERDKIAKEYQEIFSVANFHIEITFRNMWEAEVLRAKLMLADKGLL